LSFEPSASVTTMSGVEGFGVSSPWSTILLSVYQIRDRLYLFNIFVALFQRTGRAV
jgi:hypothetical protein